MLDFHHQRRQPVYLTPRRQRGLLLLVLAVGVSLVTVVRGPAWIRTLESLSRRPATAEGEVDNRMAALPAAPDAPDGWVAAGPRDASGRGEPSHSPAAAEPSAPRGFVAGVKPELLEAVRDDRPWRRDEEPAWNNLLEVLRSTGPADLQQASLGKTTYVQLFKQSAEYRGQVVTIGGTAVRVEHRRLAAGPPGIAGYYQMWLRPDDSPTMPMVVCVLELPDGFPAGEELAEPVSVTGFFLKRWAYEAQDTLRTTPMLVARSVQWTAVREDAPAAGSRNWAGSAALAGGGVLVVAGWLALSAWSRRPRPPRRLPERIDVPPSEAD